MADRRERSPSGATAPPPTQTAQATQATAGPLSLDAFSAVVSQRQAALFAFLHGLVGEAELARDLTQDAFHDAWRATQAAASPWSAAHDDDERRRWLFHTAYCRAISHLRRRKLIRWASLYWPHAGEHGGRVSAGSSAVAPEHDLRLASFEERLAETEALRAALARLRPDDAACLLLRVAQGFSAAETAAMLGTTVDAVGQRLARARKRLRVIYLEQNPPDGNARTPGMQGKAGAADERSDGDEW